MRSGQVLRLFVMEGRKEKLIKQVISKTSAQSQHSLDARKQKFMEVLWEMVACFKC